MATVKPIIIGTLNVTGIANLRKIVDDINRSIGQVQNAGNDQIAETLREIGQAILTDPRLETHARRAAILTFQTFAREASLPFADRHPAVVKTALTHIPSLLNTSLDMLNHFDVRSKDLERFFGISK